MHHKKASCSSTRFLSVFFKVLHGQQVWAALLSDITSAKELLDSLSTFEKYSGLKINVSKTKAMWIGIMKN